MSSPDSDDSERTVADTRDAEASGDDGLFVITVIDGPDKGQSLLLDRSQPCGLLVGQGPACALRLTDRAVSRRHVALEVRGRALHVRDLGSTNGTYADRIKIVEAELRGGEIVRVGSTSLAVERRTGAAPPPPPAADYFGRLRGTSLAMRRLYPLCERLAASAIPVLIEGETGTGKELLAEALHEQGPRASGPFVVFDCTAVPPSLVESELFGHERGAYTGAVSTREGVFEQAAGGTLLIDEIGDLDSSLQPKLLRAVARREVRRVGGKGFIRVDVRVIAATRRDLDREVQESRFRDDLFHRLAVGRVELPPLRTRQGDVTYLARKICRGLGGDDSALPTALLARWEEYSWPGNVRELENAIMRRLALGDLAEPTPTSRPSSPPVAEDILAHVLSLPFVEARERLMREFQLRYVEALLARHGGDSVRAAAASGIGRRYFQMLRARTRDKSARES